jgi:hypothetical protein
MNNLLTQKELELIKKNEQEQLEVFKKIRSRLDFVKK